VVVVVVAVVVVVVVVVLLLLLLLLLLLVVVVVAAAVAAVLAPRMFGAGEGWGRLPRRPTSITTAADTTFNRGMGSAGSGR